MQIHESDYASEQRTLRRNFALHISNGLFAGFADALVDTRLIVTAFLSQLTTSNVLIGLIAPLRDTGWFLPQVFITQMVERAPLKIEVYRATTIARSITWALLLIALFFISDPGLLLLLFFLCVLIISIGSGFAGLPFMMVTTKVIPATRRSTLFGLRQSMGGLMGVLAGGAVVFVLGGGLGLDFPRNYAVLFAGAAVLNITGNILFGLISEKPDAVPEHKPHLRGEFRRAWRISKTDHQYRAYLFARMAIMAGAATVPFLTVYAKRQLQVADGVLGALLSTTLISSLVANLLMGRLADHRGGRLTMLLGAGIGVLFGGLGMALTAGATASVPAFAPYALAATFIVGGVMNSAVNVSGGPLIMEIAPAERRSLYFGLTNSLLGIVMLCTSLLGVIVDRLGFPALFVFAACAYGFAALQLSRMKDPRAN